MVELRKRKAAQVPAPAPPKKAKAPPKARARKQKPDDAKPDDSRPRAAPEKPVVGQSIPLDTFGGELETNDGKKTSLKQLVQESKAGVVIFTYPKASTPGCT